MKNINEADWSFQDNAVRNVVLSFERKKDAKILIVIPTGGGKTITAIKSVHALYQKNLIFKDDKVMWVTHLLSLKSQMEDQFVLLEKDTSEEVERKKILKSIFTVCLPTEARRILSSKDSKLYKLIIIDEAHHSGASSYKDLFNKNIGIIGLTATPTRTDNQELPFDGIAFQITYRELLQRNVILKPEFLTIETNTEITLNNSDNFDSNSSTNKQYNTTLRNQAIADAIFGATEAHKKVIIFAGSNDHVDALYDIFRRKNKFEGEQYHIGFIYSESRNGKTNDKGESNDSYLKWHKKEVERSILINCAILTEGYDDSSIDTVVLTTPTKSPLYYMQCVGRVVRRPHHDTGILNQKTYVLECEDKYINFVYRINNAWLFADLSSYLEPLVINEYVDNKNKFKLRLFNLLKEHHVDDKYFKIIPNDLDPETTSVLLFKSTIGSSYKKWYPLIITPENRSLYVRIYNELSENITENSKKNPSFLIFERLQLSLDDPYFSGKNSAYVENFHQALILANDDKKNGTESKRIKYYNFILEIKTRHWLIDKFLVFLRKLSRLLIK